MSQQLEVLASHHDRFLDRHHQMILVGQWLALSVREMATTFGCSEATIRRARRETMDRIFDPLAVERSSDRLRLWAELHWGCCTAGSREMTQNSQLLTAW